MATKPRRHTPGTYGFVPAAIAADPELTKTAVRLGILIAQYTDLATGECWLSAETMAELLQTPRSVIMDGLKLLERRGHYAAIKRPGRHTIYVLQYRDPAIFGVPWYGRKRVRSERTPPDRSDRTGSVEEGDRISAPRQSGPSGHGASAPTGPAHNASLNTSSHGMRERRSERMHLLPGWRPGEELTRRISSRITIAGVDVNLEAELRSFHVKRAGMLSADWDKEYEVWIDRAISFAKAKPKRRRSAAENAMIFMAALNSIGKPADHAAPEPVIVGGASLAEEDQ